MYEILCPQCMKRYRANNVVFRHNIQKLKGLVGNVAPYFCNDPYRTAFRASRDDISGSGQAEETRGTFLEDESSRAFMDAKTVDPAYLDEQNKVYQDGLLVGVRSAGYQLDQRCCPFCHNNLYTNAGRMPLQQLSIIGYTTAGKTTFEAAMMYQLIQDGLGCVNNTLDSDGLLNDEVQRNIEVLKKGDPANPNTVRMSSAVSWKGTEQYHGPYIYALYPEGQAPTSIAFYDMPGEAFQKEPGRVRKRAAYIGTAQTCFLLVDLKNIDSVTIVINAVMNQFGEEMRANGVNVAVVLYKMDQMSQAIRDTNHVPEPLNLSNGKPVNLSLVDANSEAIRHFAVETNPNLNSAYRALAGLLGEDHIRFFTAQTFDGDGTFHPRGCDVPLLWSFARQGLYPTE